MKKNNRVLKAESFNYPTKIERNDALKNYPKIMAFQFKYVSEIESILVQNSNIHDAARISNLFWWNACFSNRLGKLRETYIYVATNYNRKFNNNYAESSDSEVINKFLFEYYAEIFFYLFFSCRDIIGQIINLYYNLSIKENNLQFVRDLTKGKALKESIVKEILISFNNETSEASNYRNSFAHRFPPTEIDNRSVITTIDGKFTLEVGSNESLNAKKIFESIDCSLQSLNTLMNKLNKILKN